MGLTGRKHALAPEVYNSIKQKLTIRIGVGGLASEALPYYKKTLDLTCCYRNFFGYYKQQA